MLNSVLNVFPELFTYSLIGPTILRLTLGLIFIDLGYLYLTKEKTRLANLFTVLKLRPADFFARIYALAHIVGGSFLIIGLYTQVVALIFSVISLLEMTVEYREPIFLKRNIIFYILLFAISMSLLFTGAGFLAFDYKIL